MGIKAKSTGLDLSSHTHSVMNTAFLFNQKGNYGLSIDVLKYATMLHDVGKANPLFQSNMDAGAFDKICRHEISSVLFIDCVPKKIRDKVAFLILSHHKSLENEKTGRSLGDLYNEDPDTLYKNHIGDIETWGKEVQEFLWLYYNKRIKIPTKERCKEILDYYAEKITTLKRGWSKERGMLMMADHFASCYDNDTERLQLTEKLFVNPDTSVYNNKDERYPLSLIDSDNTKKHTIVISSTGSGKTNFMMKRCHNRIKYTLPFQASINAMYNRFRNTMDENLMIGLLHSSMHSLSFIDEKTKELSHFVGVPLTVLTPFQIMCAVLQLKGYETLLMDLKGQDVVLDEIHTYDGIALCAIIELVKLLKDLDCNIHICTATIPTCLVNKIIGILGENNTQIVKLTPKQLDSFNRHIIHTCDYNPSVVINHYNNKEKILVIRNTVSEAREAYLELKNLLPDANILLLHSRFERWRKSQIENTLINQYNKSQKPCIVVSTQVVEVSLDINFDVMFTSCADIMSLIQRFGRINRQRDNIGLLKHIYVSPWSNPSPNVNIYPDDICEKTFTVLQRYNGLCLPEKDLQSIIDEIHPDLEMVNAERFSARLKNGEWRTKEYHHITNTNLSQSLEIAGYIGIRSSNVEKYLETKDESLEIPIRFPSRSMTPHIENDIIKFYIIPNSHYNDELGLFL